MYPNDATLRETSFGQKKTETLINSMFPFLVKRARDGDRTRDPLLGKEMLHR